MSYRQNFSGDPVRDFLNSVRYTRIEYNRLSDRIKALETQCMSITATLSAVPGGGNADAERLWAALADESAKLYPKLREIQQCEREVEQFISKLPDSAHRIVLKLRYLDGLSWEHVIGQMTRGGLYYSDRQIYRIHGEALEVARRLWNETHFKEDNDNE